MERCIYSLHKFNRLHNDLLCQSTACLLGLLDLEHEESVRLLKLADVGFQGSLEIAPLDLHQGRPEPQLSKIGKILQIFGGLVLGCIKTKFARKYAFDSFLQALQDLHTFAPLQSQNFSKKSV